MGAFWVPFGCLSCAFSVTFWLRASVCLNCSVLCTICTVAQSPLVEFSHAQWLHAAAWRPRAYFFSLFRRYLAYSECWRGVICSVTHSFRQHVNILCIRTPAHKSSYYWINNNTHMIICTSELASLLMPHVFPITRACAQVWLVSFFLGSFCV